MGEREGGVVVNRDSWEMRQANSVLELIGAMGEDG